MVKTIEEFKFSFDFVCYIYSSGGNELKDTGLGKLPSHRVYSITTRIKTSPIAATIG